MIVAARNHCRCCGAELAICDECHGVGRVQVDGPTDPETGEVGYSEDCSECSGRGGYAAQNSAEEHLAKVLPWKAEIEDELIARRLVRPELEDSPKAALRAVLDDVKRAAADDPELWQRIAFYAIKAAEKQNAVHLIPRDEEEAEAFMESIEACLQECSEEILTGDIDI